MRKIIDSNQLQSEDLRSYLSKSKMNFAVLTDYAAMEAYKGDTLASIFKSMEVLCEFPSQVIVLRGTRAACGLSGRLAGLQRRLIDQTSTRKFPVYARSLLAAKHGDSRHVESILAHGTEASAHMETMLRDAETTGEAIEEIAKLHSKEERAAFRNGDSFPAGMVDKVVTNVMNIAASLFQTHPNARRWPHYDHLPNTFLFRSSLCIYLLALDWAARGGVQSASAAKLRNDTVDMNFVTFATYFDGLLTSDAKTARLHQEARIWLSSLFDCKLPGSLST